MNSSQLRSLAPMAKVLHVSHLASNGTDHAISSREISDHHKDTSPLQDLQVR